MNFKELKLARGYDANEAGVNILKDFYIPVLKRSVKYDRVGSYFRTSVFLANTSGIAQFIKNGGTIRLIVDAVLTKEDLKAIEDGEQEIAEIKIKEFFKKATSDLQEEIRKNRYQFLSYLIFSKKLKIRVALVNQSNEHSKIGLFYDNEDNGIAFSGSINESMLGWTTQGNNIVVFNNWEESIAVFYNHHEESFERMWNNSGIRTKVHDFPEAADFIDPIDFDKDDVNATNSFLDKIIEEDSKPVFLRTSKISSKPHFPPNYEKRKYQTKAVDNWQEANYRGFFEMATGTGKTITSLRAACRLINEKEKLITLILVPSISLVGQWEEDCKLFAFERIVKVFGENKNWYNDFLSLINSYKLGSIKFPIAISTYNSFKSKKFQSVLDKLPSESLIICDEAHHLGANQTKKYIPEKIIFRLGLSATPHRHFDDSGTQDLLSYFSVSEAPTYKLDIGDAQNMNALCEYYLHIHEIKLNEYEYELYLDITKQIAKRVAINNGNINADDKKLNQLLIKRKKIINHAREKFSKVYDIINELKAKNGNLNFTLVYCPEGMDENQDSIMKEYGKMLGLDMQIKIDYFVGNTSPSDRKNILEQFANGDLEAILAMKCLDEGIDVKRTENAILVSSSTNPRQYIQRRGRILRTHPDKLVANIYDLFVLPPLDLIDSDDDPEKNNINSINAALIKQELKRLSEFAQASLNYVENIDLIRKYCDEYDIENL